MEEQTVVNSLIDNISASAVPKRWYTAFFTFGLIRPNEPKILPLLTTAILDLMKFFP